MVLNGYKTKIGILVYLVLGIVGGALGFIPESMVTSIVETLSVGLIGFGLYNKLERK